MDIKLDFHGHHLYFRNLKNNALKKYCNACLKEISNTANTYGLDEFEYPFHESCVRELQHLPLEIIHPLHSQHHLQLIFKEDQEGFICDKCWYISTFSRYECDECNFNLHLACASSTNDLLLEEKWQRFKDGKKKEIQHYSHLHKLAIFKYRKIRAYDYDCSWCGKCLSEVCYGCLLCKFFLHELCRDKVQRQLYHPFDPSHPLRLHYRTGSYCNACGGFVDNFTRDGTLNYCCLKCSFFLHFHCAKLLPTLKQKCHDHPLTYFKKTSYGRQDLFRCNVCEKLCDNNFFRCVQCNFSVHLPCVPIPSSIEHRYHRHPLIHMDWVEEDDSGEYYCDVCETERNPMDHVYCCEECTFITHAECVLNEVITIYITLPDYLPRLSPFSCLTTYIRFCLFDTS
ncbi:PREDICTED: uncharacterized protein LOC108663673 [Theobroma cacao]|uniref:Uncharacterized protein LOC108663673 n=1 Tax=Theobroma cacao TaxID=3641 RepID=A0AB32X0G4_THECC|nr:PREDICTED: uncharacterized protein LOC108663673 [Theobroma cacao]